MQYSKRLQDCSIFHRAVLRSGPDLFIYITTMKNLPYLFTAIFDNDTAYHQGEADESLIYDSCHSPEDFLAANTKAFGHEPINEDEREAWTRACKPAYFDVQNTEAKLLRFILHNEHKGGSDQYIVDLTNGHFYINGQELRMHRTTGAPGINDWPLRNMKLYRGVIGNRDINAQVKFDGDRWNQDAPAVMSEPRYSHFLIGWTAEKLNEKGEWVPIERIMEIDV